MEQSNKALTHGSLFSGVGGFDLAAELAGWSNAFNCEIDTFCTTILNHHFPNARHYSDIKATDFTEWRGKIDVLSGGFPCFPAGTKILTADGYKAIEDIEIGDPVLTDKGRFKPVNALMNKRAEECVFIKAQGIALPIATTPNHPFWIKKKAFPFARKYANRYLEPQWIYAKDVSKGDLVAYRCIDGSERYKTNAFWYLIGRYLGDGWILDGKRKSKVPQGKRGSRVNSQNWKVVICCNEDKLERLAEAISSAGYKYTLSKCRTVYKLIICSKELTQFLYDFGRYSYGKKLSGQCFRLTNDLKESLFRGWLESDGFTDKNGSFKVTTVSEELAYGMAQIARDCFKLPVSISRKSVSRKCVIEGRVVNERPQYSVVVSNSSRYGYYENGFVWCLVKDTKATREQTEVYNIGVIEDETYTVNGITVHNCQPFSQAGKRKGTDDNRYLWPEMLRAIREIAPRWVVGENVLGIVNWNGGLVFEQVCSDLEGEGYQVQPFILPACGINAPHRRYRTFFIAYRADAGTQGVQQQGNDSIYGFVQTATAHSDSNLYCGTERTVTTESNCIPQVDWQTNSTAGQPCRTDYSVDERSNGKPSAPNTQCSRGGEIFHQVQSQESDGEQPHSNGSEWYVTNTYSSGFQTQGSQQPTTGFAGGDILDGECRCCAEQRNQSQRTGIADAIDGDSTERTSADPNHSGGGTPQCGANPNGTQVGSQWKQSFSGTSRYCQVSTNTQEQRLQDGDGEPLQYEAHTTAQRYYCLPDWQEFPTQSPVCRGDDGLSYILDADSIYQGRTKVNYKYPFARWRTESIKGYGNAIVPPLVYRIFCVINKYEQIYGETS